MAKTKPVKFTVGGNELTLFYSIDAMCAYEEETGKPFSGVQEFFSEEGAERFYIRLYRALIWAGLLHHQPKTKLRDVSGILEQCQDDADLSSELATAVITAISGAQPKKDDGAADAPEIERGNGPSAPSTEGAAGA